MLHILFLLVFFRYLAFVGVSEEFVLRLKAEVLEVLCLDEVVENVFIVGQFGAELVELVVESTGETQTPAQGHAQLQQFLVGGVAH